MTARLALVGHPVAHSRSPAMMTAAFRAMGVDAAYERRDTPPGALAPTLAALHRDGYLGANVTAPWKSDALLLASAVDPVAARCGAVNTLVRMDAGGFRGCNTDAAGFARAVTEAGGALAGAEVVVLGAGGAARAVVVAAELHGAARVTVLARDPGRTRALDAVVALGGDAARATLARATLVVQATPCGMTGGPPGEAIIAAADLRDCARGALAVDLVYAPRDTPWMRHARDRGLAVLAGVGVGMLVHQGAEAIGLWFGREAPVEVMRRAVDDAA